MENLAEYGIFKKNIMTIAIRQPDLAARLEEALPQPDITFMQSRTGKIVPVLPHNGRSYPIHSRFDPVEEGRRFADNASDGYLIIFGLGGAYHLTALLLKPGITGLTIIEKDISMVRAIIENIDLSSLFSDSRVTMLVDPDPQECRQSVLEQYLPVLYGNFGTMILRSRWDIEPEWFLSRSEALSSLPDIIGRDYTVQTRFGRRWFTNAIINLIQCEKHITALPKAKRVMVTAAGPSLQEQMPRIRQLKQEGYLLLATDTSLPAVVQSGLPPDIVLSIDCQNVSYIHFIQGLPKTTLLVLDLSSPPVLTRLTNKVHFCANNHPFAQYILQYYRLFSVIDTSGGNVTHAALSLAGALGAENIRLFGADFSWPNGCPYAKGTYIYPWYQSRSNRIDVSESLLWKFMSRVHPRRESIQNGWRWRTSALDNYRKVLEETIKTMTPRVTVEPGSGVPIMCRQGNPDLREGAIQSFRDNTDQPALSGLINYGTFRVELRNFLTDYFTRLKSLPEFEGQPQNFLEKLSSEDRHVWITLMPVAASFRESVDNGTTAVKKSHEWTLGVLKNILYKV